MTRGAACSDLASRDGWLLVPLLWQCWWLSAATAQACLLAATTARLATPRSAPRPQTPLRLLFADTSKLTPRPRGYVPARKLWLRSV